MPTDRNARAACLLVALTPIAGVLGARFVGAAPASALAATYLELPPLPTLPDTQPRRLPPETLAAMASPFRAAERVLAAEAPEPEPQPEPEPAPEPPAPVPVFRLTTVMPHPVRPLAVINNRPRAIGDEVAPGWFLTAIHGDARQVTIRGPGNRQVQVSLTN